MNDTSCQTKYPIVMIHGAGFRDLKWPVYWGRIPQALERQGASVFYGLQDGWASVETNAAVLAARIDEILAQSGAEKVNIIAHSKGGLDARMAASSLGCADKIASITTVATPHRGSKTIDWLLKLPRWMFRVAAFAVNTWMKLFGDKKPDFLKVCNEFSTESMAGFNEENPDVPGIFYQSYACVMASARSDVFLCVPCFVVGRIDGPNDGLVSVESALWGENTYVLKSNSRRGISHLDEVDFRRKPLTKKAGADVSDVCQIYISIAQDLKQRGL